MKIINSIKKWFWTKVYQYEYYWVDEDLCCCGDSHCIGDYSHSFVSAKHNAIENAVKRKITQ